jgi:hypothetical protein
LRHHIPRLVHLDQPQSQFGDEAARVRLPKNIVVGVAGKRRVERSVRLFPLERNAIKHVLSQRAFQIRNRRGTAETFYLHHDLLAGTLGPDERFRSQVHVHVRDPKR